MKTICKIEGITKKYPGVTALNHVNLEIKQGEIHAIVGENGAGKSTLMNILSGAQPPTSGSIYFHDTEVHFHGTADASQMGIAMIHQELSLAPALSIAENIFLGCLPKNKLGLVDKRKLMKDAKSMLQEVGLLQLDPAMLVRDINASQQQQVEIAKALSKKADFLILDEPTSALTLAETQILLNVMRKLKEKGYTMLYISHKLEEIMEISDRISVFRDGCYIDTLITADTSTNEMICCMVGRECADIFTRKKYMDRNDYQSLKPILEVEKLKVKESVSDVSLQLYPGEVLGLTGLVGAGRSEVLQAIFGADPKISGTITIDGKPCNISNCSTAIKNGMGLVPEGRKTQGIFQKFSVQYNMTIVYLNHVLSKLGLINGKDESNQSHIFLEKLRIKTPSLEQKMSNLSGGNQQKAIIARWLINNPRILFLDEPTQGIDIGAKHEIYEIIDQLAQSGVSLIVVSSEMPETIALCDRVITMYEGSITGELYHADLSEQAIMTLMSGQEEACESE